MSSKITLNRQRHKGTWLNRIQKEVEKFWPPPLSLRREAVVKIFLPPFGCDLVRPPYRFKFIFDDIIFFTFGKYFRIYMLLTFQFNNYDMNKWLVFTKAVIMELNNISPWPCPLGFVCLPRVITWLYSTPQLFMRSVGVMVCLSLRMAKVAGSRRTQYSVVSVIFIAIIVCTFCSLFHAMANISIFLSHWYSHINCYFSFSQFMCRC